MSEFRGDLRRKLGSHIYVFPRDFVSTFGNVSQFPCGGNLLQFLAQQLTAQNKSTKRGIGPRFFVNLPPYFTNVKAWLIILDFANLLCALAGLVFIISRLVQTRGNISFQICRGAVHMHQQIYLVQNHRVVKRLYITQNAILHYCNRCVPD